MKKNLLIRQVLTLLAVAAPSCYLTAVWAALPAQVPTQFTTDGLPVGYTSRANMWLLTSALPIGVALLFTILPRLDPKHRLDGSSVNFQKLRLAVVAMLSALVCYSLYAAVHPGSMSGSGLVVLVGLLFAFLGNYLTTVQPNYFVGIRTPWTLERPTVWARTHRVGGMLFCVSGLLMAGSALVMPHTWARNILLILVLGTTAFCYAYSYFIFRQEERLEQAARH